MHAAVRPYLATGVALIGAASIAVTPVQPVNPLFSVPAVPAISSQAFTLTAQANPLALWATVIGDAINNAGAIGGSLVSDPAPILRQFLTNQFAYLGTAVGAGQQMVDGAVQYLTPDNPYSLPAGIQTAVGQLAAGQISDAFITLSQTLIATPIMMILGLPLAGSGLLEVPGKMAQNFANVVTALLSINTALPLLSSALGPIVGAVDSFGQSVQDIVGALGSGQFIEALTAAINIPAQLTAAVLNGYTDSQGGVHPGLFTFSEDAFGGGLVQTLLITIPRAIAQALGAVPPAAPAVADGIGVASASLAAGATMVSLTVPEAEKASAASEVVKEAVTSEATAAVSDPETSSPAATGAEVSPPATGAELSPAATGAELSPPATGAELSPPATEVEATEPTSGTVGSAEESGSKDDDADDDASAVRAKRGAKGSGVTRADAGTRGSEAGESTGRDSSEHTTRGAKGGASGSAGAARSSQRDSVSSSASSDS